jgi:hypothetical protein
MSGDSYLGGHTLVPWHWKTTSPRTLAPSELRNLRKLRKARKQQAAQLHELINKRATELLASRSLERCNKRQRRRILNAARRKAMLEMRGT